MRCKKHVTDISSTVGVCASCLRDRLFIIIAVQAQAQAHEDRRRPDNTAAASPLVFPRSVSPYISHRKSDTCSDVRVPDQLFYCTPQVGPNGKVVVGASYEWEKKKKKDVGSRFSWLGGFFRSKPEKLDPGPVDEVSCVDAAAATSRSSVSWFPKMQLGRRRKVTRTFSGDETARGCEGRARRRDEKGMSPARFSDEEDVEFDQWRETPRRTPAWVAPAGRRGGHGRNVSGIGFCLSPLVRASPGRHWNQKGIPPEMVVSGDLRVVPVKPSPTNAAAFCKNRSRKMADFGRFNQNR